jgi:hypothetical protein
MTPVAAGADARSTERRAAFLLALHDGCEGLCEVRALPSAARLFVPLGDAERVDAFAARYAREDLYVAVATRCDASSGTLENCRHLGALFVDIDFKGTPEPAARAALERFLFPAAARVQSGGGLHAYWLLREPLDLTTETEGTYAKQLLRRLAGALGGDPTAAEPARVLRLPGTFNHKPEYGTARPVVLEHLEADRRINPHELEEFLPPEPDGPLDSGPFVLPDRIPAHDPGRNETLWRYGRSLRAKGWKLARILSELERVNAERCAPPLDVSELADIAHNVFTETHRTTFAAGRNVRVSDDREQPDRSIVITRIGRS